jgi:hypothetical protein
MTAALYTGDVVHKRLRPVPHALRYRVFAFCADLDELSGLDRSLRLFSLGRFNLASFHPRDHGGGRPAAGERADPARDLAALRARLSGVAAQALGEDVAARIVILCYPRILGYAFNPLTTYFVSDAADRLRLMIYEVNNTFGERHTYVLPVESTGADGTVAQEARKVFYVSPFNNVEGRYGFRVTEPRETVTLGVSLKTAEGPLLKAHFHGLRQPFDDRTLAAAFARMPLMTLKVIAGIHIEAARLWLKGLRIVRRPKPPAEPFSIAGRG